MTITLSRTSERCKCPPIRNTGSAFTSQVEQDAGGHDSKMRLHPRRLGPQNAAMNRTILAIMLATAAIFIWGFLSWSVIPWHNSQFKSFKNESQILQALQQETEKGVYMLPGLATGDGEHRASQDWSELSMKETFILAAVRPGPSKRPMVSHLLGSAVFSLIQAILLALILSKSRLHGSSCIGLSVLVGLFVGAASWLPACNWFPYPLSYALPYITDYLVQGLLAGIIFAKLLPVTR